MQDSNLINRLRVRNESKSTVDEGINFNFLIEEAQQIKDARRINYESYKRAIDDSIQELEGIFNYSLIHKSVSLEKLNRSIMPTLSSVLGNLDLSRLLVALQGKDDYTLRHSVSVGVLSALIAKWLKLNEQDRTSLLMAGVLHDIGKMMIPPEILNKPGKLLDDEFEIMKKHTVYGYQLLKNSLGVSHRQALAALEHHERIDGSGYPLQTDGSRLGLFSRVVAIADVFHAMSTDRVYHDALPVYRVLRELQDGLYGQYDPQIVPLFITNMMEFLIGDRVRLSDGRTGTIVWINPVSPLRPMINIGDEYVDLNQHTEVYIQQLLID